MARKHNSLFIGKEYLNIEGRSLKHPALINEYANVNIGKLADTPIDLYGMDIETNHLTGELKLLGFWTGENYWYQTGDFIQVIFRVIKMCSYQNKSIAYWNKLDPFIIFKQFLKYIPEDAVQDSLDRFGKTGGEWNRKTAQWDVRPLVELKYNGYYFGIKNAIRSSLQFYYRKEDSEWLNTVWAYDIAQLYKFGLEREALGLQDPVTGLYPHARLDYYSKLGEEYHKIDWNRFESDKEFRKGVLHSNKLDARAVYDLGLIIQKLFYDSFNYYPKTLVSTGSLARASLVATIFNKYEQEGFTGKELSAKATADITAIGIKGHLDTWYRQVGEEAIKDFYALTMEAYSGGYIEAIRYGYTEEAYYSDIASAYPSVIKDLYDLRGSKLTYGTGSPPKIPYSYTFIRGEVNIPSTINFHPITIKHFLTGLKDTNIRATGTYIASYTIEERDYLLGLGASFKDETWYNIETTGKLSPMAEVVNIIYDLRIKQLKEGNSAEYVSKTIINSMYGIEFECVDKYEDTPEGVQRIGYRAGEFLNTVYATYITSRTRIQMCKASQSIEDNGGKVILMMTDSVFWKGTADMIDKSLVRERKTLGYFERPEKVHDLVCLGTGRYSFRTEKGVLASKKRGLNVTDFIDPRGVEVDNFNWSTALDIVEHTRKDDIKVNVRKLISVGMVKDSNTWKVEDLGRIVDDVTEVKLISGLAKRLLVEKLDDITVLCRGLIDTQSLYFSHFMTGTKDKLDLTLKGLRDLMMEMPYNDQEDINKANSIKSSKKYNQKKDVKKKNNLLAKEKYNSLKKYGYDSKERTKMSKWSNERILEKLKEDNKI